MNKARTYWTIAAVLCLIAAAVTVLGMEQTVFAGMWFAIGCMFLVFALTLSGRS
jgi:hypothetical protein